MEFVAANFPPLPNEGTNPSRKISESKKDSAVSGNAYMPKSGDVIEFNVLEADGSAYAVEQDIQNSDYKSVHIACTKNGKSSWLPLGQLTRIDADFKPTCDAVATLRSLPTVGELLKHIANKKLTVVDMTTKQFTRFGSTERENRITPIFTLA